MRPLKQCASSSQRVRFPHSEGKQTVVWMTRSEIPVAVRSLLPASPSEGSQRERAVEARSPPGSSPSLYWNPRGPKPANRGSRGKRLGSHRWCAAEPENWEGGWRSGLGNLSSFSINHQLAFAARPVTCSEKAAPSGFWKLGAKTNLARGLPEGLPHPLLTCCLCSFFFFFCSEVQAQESPACAPVLRVRLRSAGFSRWIVRPPPGGLQRTQRPRPGPAPSRGHAPRPSDWAQVPPPAPLPGSAGTWLASQPSPAPLASAFPLPRALWRVELCPLPRPAYGSPQKHSWSAPPPRSLWGWGPP